MSDEKTLPELCEEFGVGIEVKGGRYEKEADGWEHVTSRVTLSRNGRPFWEGPFKQGVGCLHPDAIIDKPSFSHKRVTIHEQDVALAARRALKGWEKPDAPLVLSSLVSDASPDLEAQDFAQWCDEYEMDTDSRKAFDTYQTCLEIGRALRRAFDSEELARLRLACRDY